MVEVRADGGAEVRAGRGGAGNGSWSGGGTVAGWGLERRIGQSGSAGQGWGRGAHS